MTLSSVNQRRGKAHLPEFQIRMRAGSCRQSFRPFEQTSPSSTLSSSNGIADSLLSGMNFVAQREASAHDESPSCHHNSSLSKSPSRRWMSNGVSWRGLRRWRGGSKRRAACAGRRLRRRRRWCYPSLSNCSIPLISMDTRFEKYLISLSLIGTDRDFTMRPMSKMERRSCVRLTLMTMAGLTTQPCLCWMYP